MPRNLPKSTLNIKNLTAQKKPNFVGPFFKNKKKPKELKKSQKLQIWPQNSQIYSNKSKSYNGRKIFCLLRLRRFLRHRELLFSVHLHRILCATKTSTLFAITFRWTLGPGL